MRSAKKDLMALCKTFHCTLTIQGDQLEIDPPMGKEFRATRSHSLFAMIYDQGGNVDCEIYSEVAADLKLGLTDCTLAGCDVCTAEREELTQRRTV